MRFTVTYHDPARDETLLTMEAELPLPVPNNGDTVVLAGPEGSSTLLQCTVQRREWHMESSEKGLHVQVKVWLTVRMTT